MGVGDGRNRWAMLQACCFTWCTRSQVGGCRDSERAHGFTRIPATKGGTRSVDLSGLKCGRRRSSILFGDSVLQRMF